MRLFIAIHPDPSLKDDICRLQQGLQAQALRGNFSRRENLHITLVFLGEQPAASLPLITAAMAEASSSAFALRLGEAGKFRRGGGDIYWLGIRQSPCLHKLYEQLARALRQRDFAIEAREFRPHITLGREIVLRPGAEPAESGPLLAGREMKVDRLSLMQSERVAGRLVYTEIYGRTLPAPPL